MRKAVYEVGADVMEACTVGVLQGVEGLAGGVAAIEEAQLAVVKALDADTYAVEQAKLA